MYLPTFWKLTTEATMYRARHMAGYGVPVTFLSNLLALICSPFFLFSHLDHVPLTLQLGLLLHHSPQERCPQERLRLKVTIHPYLACNIFAKECKRCRNGSITRLVLSLNSTLCPKVELGLSSPRTKLVGLSAHPLI